MTPVHAFSDSKGLSATRFPASGSSDRAELTGSVEERKYEGVNEPRVTARARRFVPAIHVVHVALPCPRSLMRVPG
jgi:hypothetical protein